jgi:transcriptional regulator with XRE-family HTH domain
MSINDRMKAVRTELKLTQTEFGNRVEISQGHLTSIEKGKRAVTNRTVLLVCQTYNVSEAWLRTGEGEMFVKEDGLLAQIARQYDLDDFAQRFVQIFLSLSPPARAAIKDFAQQLLLEEDQEEKEAAKEPVPRDSVKQAKTMLMPGEMPDDPRYAGARPEDLWKDYKKKEE